MDYQGLPDQKVVKVNQELMDLMEFQDGEVQMERKDPLAHLVPLVIPWSSPLVFLELQGNVEIEVPLEEMALRVCLENLEHQEHQECVDYLDLQEPPVMQGSLVGLDKMEQ